MNALTLYNTHDKAWNNEFFKINEKVLDSFCKKRNVSAHTRKGYETALIKYGQYLGVMDLSKLVKEALKEEDERIPVRERKIKKYLEGFREALVEIKVQGHTLKTYTSRVKTFYKHFGIEIPDLVSIKLRRSVEIGYFDLPDKEMIRQAVRQADNCFKSLILFMASSGTAKAETQSITVGMFLEGCKQYISNPKNIEQSLNELYPISASVVPIIRLRRIKTDKYYYTCCTPEAVTYILDYLIGRIDLTLDSPIWDYKDQTLLTKFQEINDKNEWGFVGSYRKFRSHMLRKFHASNIGLPSELVDALQGRSKNKIHETYIKTNPEKLQNTYKKVMHNVYIFDTPQEYNPNLLTSGTLLAQTNNTQGGFLDNLQDNPNLSINTLNVTSKNPDGTLNVNLSLNVVIPPSSMGDLLSLMQNQDNNTDDGDVLF